MYRCSMLKIDKQLGVNAIPWAFALNNMGQVVAANIFNHMEHLRHITAPLVKVFYPELLAK